jgi:hypothetical protein
MSPRHCFFVLNPHHKLIVNLKQLHSLLIIICIILAIV